MDPFPLPVSGVSEPTLSDLLVQVARGDENAFAGLYDRMVAPVHGLARRVVRDPARAEEITQEVFLQVWRTASRFQPERGSARSWLLTLAHRRAVDVVRHDQASTNREARYDWSGGRDTDVVDDEVTMRLEHEQVRRCLGSLTELQREAVTLAYYGGYTYGEVSSLLAVNPATIKTRMRDGLIRLRDCLGVTR
ncbi:MAG: ECF RNA polymerase sigma factor SigK [Actinomycetota bacterium]|nr:ECF RNA polymerase sigma factor SigK [Actinomycetota bacterium]